MAARDDASSPLVERLVLALNGRRYEVAAAELEPSTTLLEFIRTRTPFRGPKLGCGEAVAAVRSTCSSAQCGGRNWPHPRCRGHWAPSVPSSAGCDRGSRFRDFLRRQIPQSTSESSVKVVIGNTSAGVYKDHDLYNKYIDIGGIPELSSIVSKSEGIEIGAAITISRSIEILEKEKTISGDEYKPVGEPVKKYGVELQASGEAVYVDDIPAPKNCLHGEFIYSTRPLSFVKNITFKSSLSSQKIIAVVSAKDIPKDGQNIGSMSMFGDEPLFGDPIAEFAGQALGVVIAETQRYADMAAKQAVVEYDTVDLNPPILTMEQAVQNNSYFNVPAVFYPKQVGDFSMGMDEADHKILSTEVKLASQYYFYMETQTALAIPDEDNNMVVYSSSQYPELAQTVIAKCLGIPLANIEGSFIQGVGFFIYEEHQTNSDGLVISNSTWDYKIPTVDTIPKQFNVEVLNTGYHKDRVLSSKASGEPAVVLASSVHCALREAIRAARKDFANSAESGTSPLTFQLNVPAPMTIVKELCGFDIVEKYLENLGHKPASGA
nr:unnamed protein product [Digitaria exilis]